jgi:NAD(P)H-hydrate repair Nnr-like enzyme with NAD(P)H-hydrate dehydratase domain
VGVLVHAMAGDAAARGGERGLLASDIARELHNCVNL